MYDNVAYNTVFPNNLHELPYFQNSSIFWNVTNFGENTNSIKYFVSKKYWEYST